VTRMRPIWVLSGARKLVSRILKQPFFGKRPTLMVAVVGTVLFVAAAAPAPGSPANTAAPAPAPGSPADAAAPAPAPPSHNVTRRDGRVPSVLIGDQYECARSDPEMTVNDGSEQGQVRIATHPGHLRFDIESSPQGDWQDAYISAGNNPDGYDSAQCNWIGVGKGYVIPVPVGKSGSLTASIKVHTVAGFAGDAGFDIWLTGPGQDTGYGTTAAMEEASGSTTEVMVWLNSPGINRGAYDSLGYNEIDGRSWDVLYTAPHPWRTVVFASPLATSAAATVTDRDIHLFTLIRFAADHGLVETGAELQAIDAGFEWYYDPTGGTRVESYRLTGVK
jgi:hypothetical protein